MPDRLPEHGHPSRLGYETQLCHVPPDGICNAQHCRSRLDLPGISIKVAWEARRHLATLHDLNG
jgi:hypothetical protein